VLLFVGGGLFAFSNLPVEAFPDVTDTQVTVISLFPGRAAEEAEKQVTIPLEVGLSGLPGAVRLFSHTQFGLSFVIITFDDRYSGYHRSTTSMVPIVSASMRTRPSRFSFSPRGSPTPAICSGKE